MTPNIKPIMLAFMAVIAGCTSNDGISPPANSPKLIAEHSVELDGIWISDGYGYVIEQSGDKFDFYHATSNVCVAVDVSDITLADVFDLFRFDKSGEVAFLSTRTEPHEIAFRRAEIFPEICAEQTPATVAGTIEAVISFMQTHYAFFEARGVDWTAASQRLLNSIGTIDTDAELYDTIQRELSALNDAHVELTAYLDGKTVKFDADPGVIKETLAKLADAKNNSYSEQRTKFNQDLWVTGIGELVLRGQGHSAGNDRIRFGMAAESIGYLAIKSMGGFIESTDEPLTEIQTFHLALDRAINLFNEENAHTVIVDLSINSGGYDYIARQLAERFVNQPTPAYSLYAADSQIKQPFNFTIAPSARPQFEGKIIVLASRATVSAAELALMCFDAIASAQIAGEPSRGALSTKLAKLLPNEWELTLSNQIYLDHKGQIIEAVGVTPDIAFDVFTDDNLAENHLSAVRNVLTLVQNRSGQ